MKRALRSALVLTLSACAAPQAATGPSPRSMAVASGSTSGSTAAERQGSAWSSELLSDRPSTYLPDFSYAGFRYGEEPLPELAATHALAKFGGLPDDGQDDTAAFQAAFAALKAVSGPVVLRLAKGRYWVSDILFIERAGFVLQGSGSGPGGTVIELRRPLAELARPPVIRKLEAYLLKNDKRVQGKLFSPFSWTGGLIWTRHPEATARPIAKAEPVLGGKRGAHVLRAPGARVAAGDVVELRWFNRFGNDSPVLRHVFGLAGRIAGERLADATSPLTSQALLVLQVDNGLITVKQPLRHDVESDWGAELAPFPDRLTGVGFEHVRVELPKEPYGGHHQERGYNAFYLNDLSHGFMRDVLIHNADSAVLSDQCDHLTLSEVRVAGRPGHYGIHLGNVESVLVRDFAIEADEHHSLSFNTGSRGSVFSKGSVVRPKLDQHRGRNHQNLFDAIVGSEDGDASTLFQHGGAGYWGPAHGAFNTFWNIHLRLAHPERVKAPLLLSGVTDAGPARIVGLHANVPLEVSYPGAYIEGLGKPGLAAPSLYDEQLRRRLASSAAEADSSQNRAAPR